MEKKEKAQGIREEEQRALAFPMGAEEKAIKALEIKQMIVELYKEMDALEEAKDGPPLGSDERAMIELWKERQKKTESPFCFNAANATKTKDGTKNEQFDLALAGLAAATGSYDLHFGLLLLSKSVQASSLGKDNEESTKFENLFNSITNAMNALKPQDEIEGMLISRLVALHFQSIHYLGCAANNEQTSQGRDSNISRATKLSRLYNETLEALIRYRRKGEQKVVVQHQHVNINGGQAIVGNNLAMGGGRVQQ